jgi:hypothetical protein
MSLTLSQITITAPITIGGFGGGGASDVSDLTTTGLYSGKLDGHVGPEARAAVDSLITANDLRPQ